jgi:nitrogen regulatory protein PII
MKFKAIIALVTDDKTELVLEVARRNGATGSTVITAARGEGLEPSRTFLGLTLTGQRDVVMLVVEQHLSRHILEEIGREARFEETPGSGIAFQIDIEDAVGLGSQVATIEREIENEL